CDKQPHVHHAHDHLSVAPSREPSEFHPSRGARCKTHPPGSASIPVCRPDQRRDIRRSNRHDYAEILKPTGRAHVTPQPHTAGHQKASIEGARMHPLFVPSQYLPGASRMSESTDSRVRSIPEIQGGPQVVSLRSSFIRASDPKRRPNVSRGATWTG